MKLLRAPQTMQMECRLAWRSVDAYQRTSLTGGWKLLEQGPEKSGCFCGLLRWSIGRHGLLRSRCTYFRHPLSSRQSAVVLIAFWGLHDPSWRWRASPGLSSIPVQGEPQGSWIGIGALDPVALMGRKQQMIPWTEIHNPIGVLQRNTCLLYTSPSPRDRQKSRMPSSA